MKKLIYILSCIILSACSSATIVPTPSVKIPPIDSVTPKPIDSPVPSQTRQVINVVTPQKELSNTQTPSATAQIDPTEQAYNAQTTKIAEFPKTCALETGGNFISPNGTWLATQCAANKKGYNLEIVSKEGKHWSVKAEDYVTYDLSGFKPAHWSKDDEYLYFAAYFGGSSGGYACFSDSAIFLGLYRIRLNDGSVSIVLPSVSAFSFSPTGRRLAYANYEGLIILDLQTGSKTHLHNNNSIDTLTWSPNGLELAYASCQESPNGYGVNDDYSPKSSSVEIFSVRDDTSKTILTMEKNFSWLKAGMQIICWQFLFRMSTTLDMKYF